MSLVRCQALAPVARPLAATERLELGRGYAALGILRPGHSAEVLIKDGYVEVSGVFNVAKIDVDVPDGAADAPGAETRPASIARSATAFATACPPTSLLKKANPSS